MAKRPAIFLDRDGTIIEDAGYIRNTSDIQFYSNSFKALQVLQNYFLLFIITNQSGVSKGLITDDEVKAVNHFILEKLKAEGIIINEVFYCPHQNEDNCNCKKPNPYFILNAAELYNVDITKSYIIGDHPSDVQCGINAGVTPIYLLTGHGIKHRSEIDTDTIVCDNILEASKYINSN